MSDENVPTIEMSLGMLSDAVSRAAADLLASRNALDRARADIASRNTSAPRGVVAAAERVVHHLKEADEGLRDALRSLAER
jgi:hypothetical protein